MKNISRKNLWSKLDVLLGALLIASVFCLIFVIAHRAIFDPDIWLHLKTGELIWQTKTIPTRDIYSFTRQGKRWIDHEWLFQVISYLVYNRWQAEGLISLECYIIILSFLVLFLMGHEKIRSYLEVAIFIFLATYASVIRFNIRPDMFSLFFFSLYLYLLRFRIDKKLIWLLVPVQVLWVNFHGYFFLGPLLVLFFIIAESLRRRIRFLPFRWKREFALSNAVYKRLKILFLFTVLACLINSNGLEGVLYPAHIFKEVLLGGGKIFFKYIQELQPTFQLGRRAGHLYYLILILSFLLMAINFKRLKIIELILFVFFFFFSFTLRNIAFSSFVSYTIIISYFRRSVAEISANIKIKVSKRKMFYFIFRYGLAVMIIIWIAAKINTTMRAYTYYDFESNKFKTVLSGIDYRRYPKDAVDFILENNLPGRMFNDFNSGSYLIGKAYPERKVFIDGRTELYGPEFFKQYKDIMEGDVSAFEKAVAEYDLSAILLSISSASGPKIISYLYKNPQWKLVFLNEAGLVFLQDRPAHQELIKKYAVDLEKDYSVPAVDLKSLGMRKVYPTPFIHRAALFELLGKDDLVILETRQALKIMPDCSEAYHLLGKVYLRRGGYQQAWENLRSSGILMPTNVRVLTDSGVCLQKLNETPSAINVLKGAIRFNKRYAPAYYQLGIAYLALDSQAEAIDALKKAIRYEPENADYHFKLGQAYYQKAKKDKNKRLLDKVRDQLDTALKLASEDENLQQEIQHILREINETEL